MTAEKQSIEWIDKAKGFAILGIVALHTVLGFTITETVAKIARAGMYGVSLFFIISAYLTFLSFDKHPIKWNIKTYFKYLLHKLTRLIPVLYIAVIWHFIQYCIVIDGLPDFSDGIWLDALFASTFTNAFSYQHFNPWFNWYIGTLVIFLAIAPAIHKWINTQFRSVIFFGFSLVFAWFLRLILSNNGVQHDDLYVYCSLPIQLPVIALGIVFYFFRKGDVLYLSNPVKMFSIITAISLLLTFCASITIMEFHVFMGLLLLILSFSMFNNSWKHFNGLKTLGKYSYGIYLFHGCLIKIFNVIGHRIGIDTSSLIIFLSYYILLVFLSLLCAMLVNKYIEKPFLSYTSKRFGL